MKAMHSSTSTSTRNATRIEALEARIAPAVFIVDTLADSVALDGNLSLREAILAANTNTATADAAAGDADGDSIVFDPTVFGSGGGTIALTLGELTITDDVTIRGIQQGGTIALGVVISGNGTGRVFNIDTLGGPGTNQMVNIGDLTLAEGNAGAGKNGGNINIADGTNVTLSGVSVFDGEAENGGGIYNGTGSLKIQNSLLNSATQSVIGGNAALGAASTNGGGGIFNNGGTLAITGAMISNNYASGASGSGGGIFSASGTVTISGGSIQGNEAVRAGGGVEVIEGSVSFTNVGVIFNDVSAADIIGKGLGANPGNGGGIHVSGTANVTVTGGVFGDNAAGREGGGLWNSAAGTMTINGTLIANNTAFGDAADDGGGGVFNNGGTVNIFGTSTISGNHADGTSGSGGGIFNNSGGTVYLVSSTVSANTATSAGGGIENLAGSIIVIDSQIIQNIAEINGGGVHTTGAGSVVINGGIVGDNIAGQEGGGLWNSSTGTLYVRPYQGMGTGIVQNISNGDGTEQGGGGVFNDGGTVVIKSAFISTNSSNATAVGNGGGGIFNDGRLLLDNVALTNNTATTGSANGGGILNSNGGSLTITGGAVFANDAARAGGGIENVGGSVTMNDVGLFDNTTGINGGGLHTSGAGSVTINGGYVTGNTAGQEGGGLWNSSTGTLIIQSGRFLNPLIDGNTANGDSTEQGGGGIFNDGGTVGISDATISNNVANAGSIGNGGGGVFNRGQLTVTDSTISLNHADTGSANGGGILNSVGAALTITGTTISGNTTARAGGGLENNGGSVTITNSTFSGNAANINGGGIHTSGAGNVTIIGSTFTDNAAVSEGGGLWNSATGTMTVTDSTLSDNDASFGGGIHNDGAGTLTITDSTISGNTAFNNGGGINSESSLTITGSTISGNETFAGNGGGIQILNASGAVIRNTTIFANSAANAGGGIYAESSTVTLTSTIVAGNDDVTGAADISRFLGTLNVGNSLLQNLAPGTLNGTSTANLTGVDPLLGPLDDNGGPTLTHIPLTGSPAINKGSNPAALTTDQRGFIRTIGLGTDIGAVENETAPTVERFAVGNGKTDRVDVFDHNGIFLFNFDAFNSDRGIKKGTSVATGDINGDGVEDIIVGAGSGTVGPRVKVFDGISGAEVQSFFAFPTGFKGGVFVAAGDIDDDGAADIIVGAGSGRLGGPHVRVFDGSSRELGNLDPYGSFTGGVRVATGDVNGDGQADIITAAGPGGGPHIKVFSGADGRLVDSFFAFDSTQVGAFVSAGDFDGDGRDEIVVSGDKGVNFLGTFSRPGFGSPNVQLIDFTAFAPTFRGGVRVAVGDVNGDGVADIIAGSGKSKIAEVQVFNGVTGTPFNVLPFPDKEFLTGVFVG